VSAAMTNQKEKMFHFREIRNFVFIRFNALKWRYWKYRK